MRWILACMLLLAVHASTSPTLAKSALFVSIPVRGRLQPLIALARELESRGYSTAFALCEETREFFQADKAAFISLGLCADATVASASSSNAGLAHLHSYAEVAEELSRLQTVMLPALMEHLSDREWTRNSTAKARNKSRRPLKAQTAISVYSVIISDQWTFAGVDAADAFNVPLVLNNPHFVSVHEFDWSLMSPTPLSWIRDGAQVSLIQRLVNLYHRMKFGLVNFKIQESTRILRDELGVAIANNVQDPLNKGLSLVNTVFGFDFVRKVPSNTVLTGPLLPRIPDPLGSRLQDYLDGALRTRKHVIYVYLGDSPALDPQQTLTLLTGLMFQQKHQIIWSLPKQKRFLLPDPLPVAVRWHSYVPQLAVLAHPGVSAVVLHCGSTSLHEALYHGKPVLCFPDSVDQFDGAVRLQFSGAGLYLDREELSFEKVRWATKQVIYNDSYSEEARKVRSTLRFGGGVKQAGKLIDFQVEYGVSHLIPESYSAWRLLGVDLFALCFAFAAVLGFLVRMLHHGMNYFWSLGSSQFATKNE